MGWMIFLAKEKDIGTGCKHCRFRYLDRCMADENVDVYSTENPDQINEYRPYQCPFRHFDSQIDPITDRFYGMTTDETRGYFRGADYEHKRYIRLEEERAAFAESSYRERMISSKEKAAEEKAAKKGKQ